MRQRAFVKGEFREFRRARIIRDIGLFLFLSLLTAFLIPSPRIRRERFSFLCFALYHPGRLIKSIIRNRLPPGFIIKSQFVEFLIFVERERLGYFHRDFSRMLKDFALIEL